MALFDFLKKKKKKEKAKNINKQLAELEDEISTYEKHITLIEKRIQSDTANIKKFMGEGKKARAKIILRQRKKKTNDMEALNSKIGNLMAIQDALVKAQMNESYVRTTERAKTTLQNTMPNVDKVDAQLDDLRAAMTDCNDVNDILNQNLDEGEGLDDDELMDEYQNEIANEGFKDELNSLEVKSTELTPEAKQQQEEDAELADIIGTMNSA